MFRASALLAAVTPFEVFLRENSLNPFFFPKSPTEDPSVRETRLREAFETITKSERVRICKIVCQENRKRPVKKQGDDPATLGSVPLVPALGAAAEETEGRNVEAKRRRSAKNRKLKRKLKETMELGNRSEEKEGVPRITAFHIFVKRSFDAPALQYYTMRGKLRAIAKKFQSLSKKERESLSKQALAAQRKYLKLKQKERNKLDL